MNFFKKIYSKLKPNFPIYLLYLGTIFYKFSYESTVGINLIILARMPPKFNATILGVLLIINFISQCISSFFVPICLMKIKASKILGITIIIFGCFVGIIIIVEAITGGKFGTEEWKRGANWLPYMCIVIHFFNGFCYGIVDILRKYMPSLIVRNKDENSLKQLNASVHIIYEIFGVVGAFFASFMIKQVGNVFCMIHIPICFLFSGIFMMCIKHRKGGFDEKEVQRESYKISKKEKCSKIKGVMKFISNPEYNWLIVCYVVPQVIHRIKESVFISYFSQVIEKYWFSGMLFGFSNFGELIGAGVIFLISFTKLKKAKHTSMVVFLMLGIISLNSFWMLVPFDWDSTDQRHIHIGMKIMAIIVMITAGTGYASCDVCLVSFLQMMDKKVLPDAMSFLYFLYIVVSSVFTLAVVVVLDVFGSDISKIIVCALITFASVCVFITFVVGFISTKMIKKMEKKITKRIDSDTIEIVNEIENIIIEDGDNINEEDDNKEKLE